MRKAAPVKKVVTYTTWHAFTEDLVKKLGCIPTNSLWLEIKPEAPLPWSDSHLQACLSAISRLERQKVTRKVDVLTCPPRTSPSIMMLVR